MKTNFDALAGRVDRALRNRSLGIGSLGGPMTREDRKAWATARTLDELCELTARWLEGRLASQPGYWGPCDVDEKDAPGLTATLVALNRAGYLTHQSQAGTPPEIEGKTWWQQRAAVQGFASPDTCQWLRAALALTRFKMIVWPCKPAWRKAGRGVEVTVANGRMVTGFGWQMGTNVIAGELYGGCSDEAIDVVCASSQVTIYDPDFGRNDLWPVLRKAADRRHRRIKPTMRG